MATQPKKAVPLPTKASLAKLDNQQLLKLFALVVDDVQRRLKNYETGPNVVEVVVDGLHFVGAIQETQDELTHGRGWRSHSGREDDISTALMFAVQRLEKKLVRSSLASQTVDADWDGA